LFSLILPEGTGRGYVILALTVTFLAFQQGAISPVTWLMLSEIFPLKMRGLGMGASAFVLWIVNFLIGFGFPQLLAAIGISNTFFVFAVLGVGAIAVRGEVHSRDQGQEPRGRGALLQAPGRPAAEAKSAVEAGSPVR
jgi:major inositol transporter-like SP family MFS transporter